jgi:murein DD-endopeptidase MepM/ murein hydrolase activator NlpD
MTGLLWPIDGHAITQWFDGDNPFEPPGFVLRDPTRPRVVRRTAFPGAVAQQHLHGAIDIGCPIGTPILAPEAGRIVAASTYLSTGEHYMMLEVRKGTILFFTHLKSFTVPAGHAVARGQEIGRTGNSGMSTGPHLHWEVRVTTNPDPDFRLSGRWFKWNPNRLRVGGNLADLAAIRPLGAAAAPPVVAPPLVPPPVQPPVAPALEPEPDANPATGATAAAGLDGLEGPADPNAEPDTVGDDAALRDRLIGIVERDGTPIAK